ncbi:MAG: hypothetical protein KF683_17020 [Rubrivivax sp.]|nr:hypothetical protein [Rubrivivax sp.]
MSTGFTRPGADSGSDEHLNAFVDGELGPAEAAALLARLREDPVLRERITQLRLAKDLVRHAYASPPRPATRVALQHLKHSARAPALRWRTALASLAFGAGALAGWAAHDAMRGPGPELAAFAAEAPVVADAGRVVLHLNSDAPDKADAVVARADELLRAARAAGRSVEIEIVVNGPGLDLLRNAGAAPALRLASLRHDHPALGLVACGQTVQKLRDAGTEVRLVPGATVASSALDQIVMRMQQGWTYVRI